MQFPVMSGVRKRRVSLRSETSQSSGHKIVFELCAQQLEACLAARPGGADRVEICTRLDVGGLTPPPELVEAVVEQSGLPVYMLLRPTAETFVVSAEAERAVRQGIGRARDLGVAGVVLGFLRPDRTVPGELLGELVQMAEGLEVTFHRAIDEVPDQAEALEAVIASGCHRVLTSGGKPEVRGGAHNIAALVQQAGDRIHVAVGGGLTLSNAAEVARITGATHFHGSMRSSMHGTRPMDQRIRTIIDMLARSQADQDLDAPRRPRAGHAG